MYLCMELDGSSEMVPPPQKGISQDFGRELIHIHVHCNYRHAVFCVHDVLSLMTVHSNDYQSLENALLHMVARE